MSSTGLSIVGQGMSRHEFMPISNDPSHPLFRKSRAAPKGSLANHSMHDGYYGSNNVPGEYLTQNHHQSQSSQNKVGVGFAELLSHFVILGFYTS